MDTPPDDPPVITVLTLNCWGLKYISALRAERLAEIGRRLAVLATPSASASASADDTPPLSLVALQECWCHDDFAAIHAHTRAVLPYAHFFRAGVWGAGLAVLSRWPLTQASMHAYALNGRPTAFWRGDWFVGKGVATATVRVSPQLAVDLLVTHTHAPYEARRPDDSYLAHQLAQVWDMGRRAAAAAERSSSATTMTMTTAGRPPPLPRLTLVLGDFNMVPLSLQHRLLCLAARAEATGTAGADGGLQLLDVWRVLHPDSSLGPADHLAEQARQQALARQQQSPPSAVRPAAAHIPTAAANLADNGATSDNVLNTWRWPKDQQKRLCQRYRSLPPGGGDAVAACAAEFAIAPDTPDPRGKRLDYIFYVSRPSATPSSGPSLAWTAKTARVAMTEPHPTLGCSVSDHFAVLATLALAPVDRSRILPVDTDADLQLYDRVLTEIDRYTVREHLQQFWRSAHFFAAFLVAIGCHVAVWFVPRLFVAFLLMLLSTLGLAAGLVDGLLALLFFGSEIRTLQEFRWQIANARAAIHVPASSQDSK